MLVQKSIEKRGVRRLKPVQ